MVVGGGDIYAQAMALADRLDITHVQAQPEGDALFPAIDPASGARRRVRQPPVTEEGPAFVWVTYERRNG